MKRLTKNQINQIKRLALKGASDKEIAEKTNSNVAAVNYHSRQMRAAVKKTAEKVDIAKPKVKNVTPKKMAVPTPAVFDEEKVREYMTGYLDGLSIKYDIPRADIDRVVFSVLQLPLSVRLFG